MSGLAAARELRAFLRRHGCRTAGSATAALETLGTIVPSDCLALSSWDPATGRHLTLASTYPAAAMAFLNDEWHHDPLFLLPRRRREPVRIRDVEPLRRHGGVFDRVIAPGGFRAGMTQCLFAADGRYVGMINANAVDDRLDDDVVHLVDGSEVLAVDVVRSGAGIVVLHRRVPPPDGLTVRELHVLAALADGLSNAQIGDRCGISARTVGTHVEHILMKTGSRTRAEAAGRAVGWRLSIVR